MSSIDQRIVEMKFENHLFEKNAATTISTLEKLKQALNFSGTSSSIDELQKSASKIDFSSLANSISTIEDRFSIFGIAGMTVIQNLTNEALKLGKTLVNNVMEPITSGGWSRATNIDKAKFQLRGLQVAWDDIEKDINYGVSDTAYGLDAAATAASQLVASGVEFGETFGETGNSPMAKALRGISGVAAMTNSSYEEIAHIFTTVAGQGKVMTMQLRQLELRGLNAAAKLGEAMGKTEEEIRSMVTKGEIDFATFSEKMDEAFGEHAKEANTTFEGALANMKAALARVGAEFAGPFRSSMIQIFNQLKDIINTIKKEKLGKVFTDFADFAEKASNLVTNILKNLDFSWVDKAVDGVHRLYTEFDGLMSSLFPFWKKTEEASEEAIETTKGLLKSAEEVNEIAKKVLAGEYGVGEDRINKLKEEGYVFEQIQNAVNEMSGNDFRYDLADVADLLALEELKDATEDINKNLEKTNEEIGPNSNFSKLQRISRNAKQSILGIKAAFNILKKTLSSVAEGALEPLVRIGLSVADTFFKITRAVSKAIVKFSNFLSKSKAYEALTSTINTVLNKIADGFDWISNGIDKLLHSESPLTTFFEGIQKGFGTDKVQTFSEWIETATGNIFDLANVLGTKAIGTGFSFLGKLLGRAIKLMPTLIKLLPLLYSLYKVINLIRTPASIVSSVTKTLAQVPKTLKAFTNQINAEALFKVAEAIGVLALSLGLISLIPSEKLVGSVIALGILAGALVGLWAAFNAINAAGGINLLQNVINSFTKAFTNQMNSESLFKIAEAIGVVALAFWGLGQLSWDQLKVGAAAIVIITLALIALFKVLGSRSTVAANPIESLLNTFKQSINNLGRSIENFLAKAGTAALIFSLTAFVAAIGVTINALVGIPWDEGLKACAYIGIVMLELVGTLALIKQFADGVGGVGMAVMVAALAYFISSMGTSIKTLSKISWAAGLRALTFMAIILGELIVSLALIKKFAEGAGGIKTAIFMIVLTKVLDSISTVIERLSAIPFAAGLKALFFLALIFTELTVTMSVFKKLSGEGATIRSAAFMAVLAFVTDSLSKTIKRLSKIPFAAGLKAIAFLGLIFLELIGVMQVSSKLSGSAGIGNIFMLITYVLAIRILAGAIEKIAKIDPAGLTRAVAAITVLSAVIAGLMYVNSITSKTGNILQSLLSIVPIILILGSIVIALVALSEVDPANLEAAGKAIGAIMAAVALFTAATKIPTFGSVASLAVTFVGIAALIGEIAGIFYLMRNMDTTQMMNVAKAMSVLMLSLGVMSAGVGRLGGLVNGAGSVLAADILLADIVAIEALAAFVNEHFPGFKTFLDKGLPLLESIGKGIGTFFGSILGGIVEQVIGGIGNGMENLGTGLKAFVDNIIPFLDSVNSLEGYDTSGITNLSNLMSAVGSAGWASFTASIAGAFADTTGLESPLNNLKTFVDRFSEFSEVLDKIDTDNSDKLEIIKSVLTTIGDIEWETFIAQFKAHFAGDIDISKTFAGLETFITNFNEFDMKLREVSDAETSLSKLDSIKQIIQKLGESEMATFWAGVKSNFTGKDSFVSMGGDLKKFAQVMVDYSAIVVGVDNSAVKKSGKAVEILTALATNFPNSGGFFSFFTGDSDFETFGKGLVQFGQDLADYSDKLSNHDLKAAIKATKAIKDLNDIFVEVSNSGMLNQPAILGDNLITLGNTISQLFSDLALAVTSEDAIADLASAGREMFMYLMQGFEEAGSEANTKESKDTVVAAIVESMLKGLTGDEAKNLVGDKAEEVMKNMIKTMADAITTEGANLSSSFGDAVKAMLSEGTGAVTEDETNFVDAIKSLLDKMIDKIKTYESKFKDRIGTLCELMVAKLKSYESKFETVGTNMMSGLTRGIKSGESKAIKAAADAAANSLKAAKEALDSNSPSKEFLTLGKDAMEGYALGIIQNNRPIREISQVAESTLITMSDRLGKVSDISEEAMNDFYSTMVQTWLYITSMVDQDLVYKPVITPVMDLSNMKDGLSSATSMLQGFNGMATPVLDYSNAKVDIKSGDLYNQAAIIDAITGVQKNVELLGNEISKMQILMNTGEVVGAITSGVDRELGSIQKYNARWA